MITALRCGVDTLEATFEGTLDPEFVEELERRKTRAQQVNEADQTMLAGMPFDLLPKGQGFWPYMLRNEEMIVWLGVAKHVPAMKVRLLAEGLASMGADKLWAKAREVADDLGLVFRSCSRLDIALDWQGHWFTPEEMRHIVCPSGFRPVYPSIDKPETYQFGQQDMVVRVYNKSVEIVKHRHEWWKLIWRICPGYDAGLPVYRVETQMRGPVLRELGYGSVERIFDELPEIFSYGLTWCSLRVPTDGINTGRWLEDPRWEALRTAFAPSKPLGRVRPAKQLLSYDASVKRFVGLITSAGASLENDDYWGLARAITTDAERLIEKDLETTFSELVEKKQKRKYL